MFSFPQKQVRKGTENRRQPLPILHCWKLGFLGARWKWGFSGKDLTLSLNTFTPGAAERGCTWGLLLFAF